MTLSYVLVNVELGSEEKVLNEVRGVPRVKECHRIYGTYDMIVKVEADSMDELKSSHGKYDDSQAYDQHLRPS